MIELRGCLIKLARELMTLEELVHHIVDIVKSVAKAFFDIR